MRAACVAAAFLSAMLAARDTKLLDECRLLRHHGRRAEANACFQKLAAFSDPFLKAEGLWGLSRFEEANNTFRAAVKLEPKNPEIRVRWGRLFLERFNRGEAGKLFSEALELDEKHPGALLGLALVASEGFESKAGEFATQALEGDPKLAEAREVLAWLALEDSNPTKAIEEADKALEISSESLDAMAIRATVDLLAGGNPQEWFSRVVKINPLYGRAWAIAGHFFVINRRYEEGIEQYRKAIEVDPLLWEARSELGINLMRLGREKEARENLELCYDNRFRNAATVNTLRLMDSYKNFRTFETPRTVLRLHRKEADLLRPYFQAELEKAVATFEKKYQLKLEGKVQLEVYPDHEDFAVRTMGLPGLGALGVTFGNVVAMDSPSGRKPGTFHWASTLWHELSHVFVLTATNHRVPRWFTEGMAVHEETAVSPEWGDRLDPEILAALRDNRLLPVAQLDRGFIRPTYPSQVVVSYFQAGRICDYIASRWGYQKLLDMMHAFATSKSTPEVIEEYLGMKPEAFDKAFLAWIGDQTKRTVEGFAEWRKTVKEIAAHAKAKRYDEVIRLGKEARDIYPDYVEAGSVYEFLADAYLEKNDKTAAIAELRRYAKAGGKFPSTLKRLAKLEEETGNPRGAAEALNRINYIYPVNDEDLHRRLGGLWLSEKNVDGAIREFHAALASAPADTAGTHYDLARAYLAANRREDARDQLLLALEAAPSYRPAQKLLLELTDK